MMNKRDIALEISKLLPDKLYLQLMYKKHYGRFIDFKNPQSYNEKLQWIKIYDRNPEYTKMVDKIAAKEYVSTIIGEKYIVPLLRVWDTAEEICLDGLPKQFVMKSNHDSKGVLICDDISKFDLEEAKKFFAPRLKRNGFWYGREWPYKNVVPKVFAETYLDSGTQEAIRDFKVLCFDGKARLCEIHIDRFGDHHTQDMYRCDEGRWEKTDIAQGPMSDEIEPRPVFLEEMIQLSEKLSKNIRHVRVDWYFVDQLYFGELTFFDGSGFEGFDNPEHDLMIGKWFNI